MSIRLGHAAAILLSLMVVGPAAAQVRLGSEFRVNSYTTSGQASPGVASDAEGNFVVVWESNDQDGDDEGIFAQRYDASGSAVGGEFQVNSYTTYGQMYPAVASDAEGNFVVIWASGEFRNSNISFEVIGRRYDASGNPIGGEFQVNTYTTGDQLRPAVASDLAGNFVVVWNSYEQDGDLLGLWGQRYDASGNPLGGEFHVNTYTTNLQKHAAVASDAEGNFVVAWQSGSYGNLSPFDVFGQRYDSSGDPLGGEFRVNTYTPVLQTRPAIISRSEGDFADFVVVWSSGIYGYINPGDFDVFGQRYGSAGNRLGGEFQVNTFRAGYQWRPAIGSLPEGDFVVLWESGAYAASRWRVPGQHLHERVPGPSCCRI